MPVNLRRLFTDDEAGVNLQARIILGFAYLHLQGMYGDKTYRESFDLCISSVVESGYEEEGHFSIRQSNRLFLLSYEADTSDVSPLLTCWAGWLFLKIFQKNNRSEYLKMAESVANYFVNAHPKDICGPEEVYFRYVPTLSEEIFNCSAMISAFLVEFGNTVGNRLYEDLGIRGLKHVIGAQNPDGSWFYGRSRRFRYVDNFHTAFVLTALCMARSHYGPGRLEAALDRGLSFYRRHLFKRINPKELRPVHFLKRYPPINSNIIQQVDLRDAASAMILFSCLGKTGEYVKDADDVLRWTLKYMRLSSGFSPEITWFWRNKIPYIEYQAYMFLAIVLYYRKITRG